MLISMSSTATEREEVFFERCVRMLGYPLAVMVISKLKFVIPDMVDETASVNFA